MASGVGGAARYAHPRSAHYDIASMNPEPSPPARPIVVVMGVSGSGKTTVGQLLAERLAVPFADADAFHPPASVAKMARGEALGDADRAPWLADLRALLQRWAAAGSGGVLACSALKAAYREDLRVGDPLFCLLTAAPEVLRARLAHRTGHFFDPRLLGSQVATLEVTADLAVIDTTHRTPEAAVEAVQQALARRT